MTTAEVKLWGRTVGAVSVTSRRAAATFEYAPEFLRSGWDVAPLSMPRGQRVFEFPALTGETFRGLPGLLADSLPDHFGRLLIDAWLRERNRSADDLDAVELLCYVGSRGMGALEYEPALGDESSGRAVEVEDLAQLAESAFTNRRAIQGRLAVDRFGKDPWRELFHAGTSAGGANPKAIIAWNEATGEVRSGEVTDEASFGHWLLKFDRGRDGGAIEFAYSQLAASAGIDMAECRLWPAGRRRHFMTRRFDRTEDGGRRHVQTLGALAHWDFRFGGAFSYEGAFAIMRQLGLPMADKEALFRRMAFNVFASNRDDHVKNLSFVMDRQSRWSLAPAYDLTYVLEGDMGEGLKHQMTINGKADGFKRGDLLACAASAGIAKARASAMLDEVRSAVGGWRFVAEDVGVDDRRINAVSRTLSGVRDDFD